MYIHEVVDVLFIRNTIKDLLFEKFAIEILSSAGVKTNGSLIFTRKCSCYW